MLTFDCYSRIHIRPYSHTRVRRMPEICSSCGEPIAHHIKDCPNCGNPLAYHPDICEGCG